MLPLGFIIFPYFIILISKLSYQKSFLVFFLNGFLFGFGFLVIYLSWLRNPFLVYDDTKTYAFLALLLPIFLSFFFGFSFILYKYLNDNLHKILITPFIFILIEFMISNFVYGFPWVSNSLILSNNIPGFYLLKYLGIITSGYLVVLFFLAPLIITHLIKIKKICNVLLIAYSPLILILLIPILHFFFNEKILNKKIVIEVNQLVHPTNLINKKLIEENIFNLIQNSKSEYIIFAENNFPYSINKNNLSKLTNVVNNNNKKVIIGATTVNDTNYYNSFLLLETEKIYSFDKKILVPFGEFLPFRKYLNFMEIITGGVDFKKGNTERIITTTDNLKILPIICYEIIFNKIFRNLNKKDIDILINITNDTWFGNKIGPYQHFYISRIRALIANKPLIRVSNNGVSAIIDNNGKIIKSTKLNKITSFDYELNIYNSKSFFALHKIFTYYLFLIFILLIIFIKSKKNEN